MVLCGRNVPLPLFPVCLSLAFYLCLLSLRFLHFSLNSSVAASFNILSIIYFCPYLDVVRSASAKLSFSPYIFLSNLSLALAFFLSEHECNLKCSPTVVTVHFYSAHFLKLLNPFDLP